MRNIPQKYKLLSIVLLEYPASIYKLKMCNDCNIRDIAENVANKYKINIGAGLFIKQSKNKL